MTKQLYEIHITTYTRYSVQAKKIAEVLHWKTSEIARDPVLGNDTYFYLTKYAENLALAHQHISEVVNMLRYYDVIVVREKIEHIVHDIRHFKK